MYVLVIGLLVAALVFGPGLWVQRVMSTYSEPSDRYPGTGAALARKLLDASGLLSVKVEATRDGDHYDPEQKAVRLSDANYNGRSLTAITVAAHEVGHALQDRDGYTPLRLRSHLVRVSRRFEKIGAAVLMVSPLLGAVTRVPMLGILMFGAGMATLLSSTLVHAVTLPTELDASFGRALPLLDRHGILRSADRPHARRLLKAAAMTYVAASLMSLLNVARWWAILRR